MRQTVPNGQVLDEQALTWMAAQVEASSGEKQTKREHRLARAGGEEQHPPARPGAWPQ